jgi:HPt (histidine-containing phosphotransfer) domain-containing protein
MKDDENRMKFLSDQEQHKETLRLHRLENLRANHAEVRCADLECELAVVREQRDRAMELIKETADAHRDVDNYHYNECDSIECEYCLQYEILRNEIEREKEAK